jgi:para-nitrobenzyl esterase
LSKHKIKFSMTEIRFFAMVILLCICDLSAQENTEQKKYTEVIQTAYGKVRGMKEGGISVFKGIPYAAPPVGEFRWRPPQPVTPWEDVFEANAYGANCAQAPWPRNSEGIAEDSSEDCLFLNLWVSADTKSEAKLPIMVWIHGGGFVGGSGAGPATEGIAFAENEVILMTFNYRLGRLGHFAFPALTEEHPEKMKGSYAYMDQIAALQWVQDNIAKFGGDPNNVTIFGESAGGVSVQSLLTIPSAQTLFHKAIIQSGGGRDGVLTGRPIDQENADPHYPISAQTIGTNFAQKHGITSTNIEALEKLRALTVTEIVDGGQENYGENAIPIYSGPIRDGKLVVRTAERAYKTNKTPNKPIIIGSNSAEVPAGFVNAETKEELWSLFGNMADEAKQVFDLSGTKELPELLTMINTDKVWAEPARFTANAFAKADTPAYIYLFSYVPKVMKERFAYGAPHASEIPYVFDNLDARWGIDTITPKDEQVAETMKEYWINFAKMGNPNGDGLPKWPAYSAKSSELLEIQADGTFVPKTDPKKARLDIIKKAVASGNLY